MIKLKSFLNSFLTIIFASIFIGYALNGKDQFLGHGIWFFAYLGLLLLFVVFHVVKIAKLFKRIEPATGNGGFDSEINNRD